MDRSSFLSPRRTLNLGKRAPSKDASTLGPRPLHSSFVERSQCTELNGKPILGKSSALDGSTYVDMQSRRPLTSSSRGNFDPATIDRARALFNIVKACVHSASTKSSLGLLRASIECYTVSKVHITLPISLPDTIADDMIQSF